MLPAMSLYAQCRGWAAAALWLLLAGACEGPQDASPGLEPPNGRDGGGDDAFGNADSPAIQEPGRAAMDAGVGAPGAVQPPLTAGAAGMSSSAGNGGMMTPPNMMGPPDEADAGTEPGSP